MNEMEWWIMLTYEELEKVLYVVAKKYAKHLGGKVQVDELVNAVWLKGNIQKLPDIRLAWRRAIYDMIDYVRTEFGYKDRCRILSTGKLNPNYGRPGPKMRVHMRTIDTCATEDGMTLAETLGECDLRFNEIDESDFFNFICHNLTRREKLIVSLKLHGFTHKEVGEVVELAESRVSQILIKEIGPRILVNLHDHKEKLLLKEPIHVEQ
jgi:hypothetical protein